MKAQFTRSIFQTTCPANPHGAAATERANDDAIETMKSRAWKARLFAFWALSIASSPLLAFGADDVTLLASPSSSSISPSASGGKVHVKTGEYSLRVHDRVSSDPSIEIRRSYRSRSVTSGLFGFGWCSEIEKKLEMNGDGSLRLKNCDDASNGISFRQIGRTLGGRDRSKFNPEKTPERKRRAPQRESELAPYFANDPSFGRIEPHPTSYLHTLPDGSTESFSKDGHLLSFSSSLKVTTRLIRRSDGTLVAIVFPNAKKLIVKIDDSGRLVSLHSDDGGEALVYQYENGNLLRVRSRLKTLHHYSYDEFRNLVLIDPADGKREILSYFSDIDRVKRHSIDTCHSEMTYKSESTHRRRVRLTRHCEGVPRGAGRHPSQNGINEVQTYEFIENENPSRPSKSKIEDSLGGLELESRAEDARIESIQRNGRKLKVHYDDFGRVSGFESPGEPVLHFHYTTDSLEPTSIAIAGRRLYAFENLPAKISNQLERALAIISPSNPTNTRSLR